LLRQSFFRTRPDKKQVEVIHKMDCSSSAVVPLPGMTDMLALLASLRSKVRRWMGPFTQGGIRFAHLPWAILFRSVGALNGAGTRLRARRHSAFERDQSGVRLFLLPPRGFCGIRAK
jgi:hypothetical protein